MIAAMAKVTLPEAAILVIFAQNRYLGRHGSVTLSDEIGEVKWYHGYKAGGSLLHDPADPALVMVARGNGRV